MTAPQEANPNRRALMILGIGLGVLLLIFVVTRLGDDDAADDTLAVPATAPPGVSTTIAPPPAAGAPGETPVESFEVFNTKNPFVPLRVAAGAGGSAGTTGAGTTGAGTTAGGTGTTTGTATTGGGTATGTGTGGTGTTTGTSGAAKTGGATEPRRGARVALLDVFSEAGKVVANVRVNDQVFKVSAGQTFGTNFQAVSLSQADDCGRFLFGDDQFRLCKGEETLK